MADGDSDSDEYEVMTLNDLAEMHQVGSTDPLHQKTPELQDSIRSQHLQFVLPPQQLGPQELPQQQQQQSEVPRYFGVPEQSPTSHQQQVEPVQQQQTQQFGSLKKEKKDKNKKKSIFRRLSKGKTDTKKVHTIVHPCSAIAESPAPSPLLDTSQQSLSLQPVGSQLESPMVGPKPPKKLTEHEVLERIKHQQRVMMEAAKKDRLRRSSESNIAELHHKSAREYHPGYIVDRSYGELEVRDILERYSDHLPLKVLVTKGTYGMDERYSLSTSERCVVHYIKRRELVLMQDPKTNAEFSVPVNSAIKFGIVYNPHGLESQAMKGLEFQYVSDILAETKLPKIGVARLRDPDMIGMQSVEILVIKEVIYPESALDPRRLCVYSLTAKCEREIPETQEINFHTTPSLMQLYLPDILKVIPKPTSLHVAMFRNPLARPLVAPGIPSTMFRRPMYLKKRYTDILLIATGCTEEEEEEGAELAFEIPTDIDVEFEVIKCSPEEKEKLKEETKKLREKSGSKNIRHHRYSGMTDEQHRLQLSLYKSVRDGVENEATDSAEVDDDYVRATSGNRLAMSHRVELLEENMKRCSYSLAESKATISALSRENEALTERVRYLEEVVSEHRQTLGLVESIERQLDRVYTELEARASPTPPVEWNKDRVNVQAPPTMNTKRDVVHSQLSNEASNIQTTPTNSLTPPTEHGTIVGTLARASECLSTTNEAPPTPEGSEIEAPVFDEVDEISEGRQKNRMLLSHMSKAEVSKLLTLAGLEQYAECLSREEVRGDILVECTNEMLEIELGIVSEPHRLKMLELIEGKAPDAWYILGE